VVDDARVAFELETETGAERVASEPLGLGDGDRGLGQAAAGGGAQLLAREHLEERADPWAAVGDQPRR
jgi:hypothetical protein